MSWRRNHHRGGRLDGLVGGYCDFDPSTDAKKRTRPDGSVEHIDDNGNVFRIENPDGTTIEYSIDDTGEELPHKKRPDVASVAAAAASAAVAAVQQSNPSSGSSSVNVAAIAAAAASAAVAAIANSDADPALTALLAKPEGGKTKGDLILDYFIDKVAHFARNNHQGEFRFKFPTERFDIYAIAAAADAFRRSTSVQLKANDSGWITGQFTRGHQPKFVLDYQKRRPYLQ